MKKIFSRRGRGGAGLGTTALLGLALALGGCQNPNQGPGTVLTAHVYAVASHSGNLYELDDSALTAATTPLLSTAQNATGELVFHKGIGFVAVSSFNNTEPGLYYFNPAKPEAGSKRIGSAISAAYIAFASDSLGFVTSYDNGHPETDGLYTFNPSDLKAGLTLVAGLSLSGPQDVAVGADGRVYVAEMNAGRVARLNAAGTAVDTVIACTKAGATGLLAGSYKGEAGIFVGNTGDYATGSVDFIANSGSTATAVVTGPVATRLALLGTTLLTTGGYPAATVAIDLDAALPTAVELKAEGSSFGGGDIAVYDGYAYLPDGANTVYAYSPATGVTAIPVGTSGELITNVGVDD
jgi:hypothetical protein